MAGIIMNESNLESDSEWGVVLPKEETEIPYFGENGEDKEPVADTRTADQIAADKVTADAAEAEKQRLAAEAGKTPEEIEADRLLAEEAEKQRIAAEAGKTPEEIAAAKTIADEAANRERIRQELLKEMGVSSVDEIKKLREPEKPETEEEKAKRLEKQEASFHQYAVTNDKMSLAEINTFKQLSALPPADLVSNDFANEYREAHKDRKDADGKADPVTNEEIQEAFETVFNTKSEDPVLKKVGERAIAARAKEILSGAEQKYNEAKQEFEGLMDRKAKMPEFKSFVQGALREAIPEKLTYTVDGREFHVELDKADFAEIENKFKDDNIFGQFYNATDRQGLKESIKGEAQRQVAEKYIQKVAEVSNRAGYSKGLIDGKVGARAPFTEDVTKPVDAKPTGKLTPEEKANIRQGLGQFM